MMNTSSFLDAKYWLPRDVDWKDLPVSPRDMLVPIVLALPIVVLRILYESLVGVTLGYLAGFVKAPLLSSITSHLFGGFATQTRSKRVLETFFRFSAYSALLYYGATVLHDKPWFFDVSQCWRGYPFHHVTDDIWWYYMIETAFYYALLIATVFDTKRSDYMEMNAHHVVTIGLLTLSYTINFVRVGTLVLFSHDIADVLLEVGKLLRYGRRWPRATNAVFAIFLAGWVLTRILYYPLVVIRSAVFEAATLIQPDYDVFDYTQIPYVPRFIISLLVALMFLHIFWTYLIFRMVVRTFTHGEVADIRSEDEDDDQQLEKQRAKKLRSIKDRNGQNNNHKPLNNNHHHHHHHDKDD